MLVPPVRVERTLLAELDFESSASTNSATGARESAASEGGAAGQPSPPLEIDQAVAVDASPPA